MDDRDDQRNEDYAGRTGVVVFPDVLAPPARTYQDNSQDYYQPREQSLDRTYSASLLDPSSFNVSIILNPLILEVI